MANKKGSYIFLLLQALKYSIKMNIKQEQGRVNEETAFHLDPNCM